MRCLLLKYGVLIAFLCFSSYATALELTPDERRWLTARGEVRYCSDSGWMPFDSVDRRGNHIGIGADFIREFSRMLKIDMQRVETKNWSQAMEFARQRKCDFLSMTNYTKERAQYFDFTQPYVTLPVVLFAPRGRGYIDGLKTLEGESIALQRDGVLVTKIRASNGLVDIRQYNSSVEQLKAVLKGEVSATAMPLAVGLYHIQKLGLTGLEVSGQTQLTMELGLAVRNDDPQLVALLTRAVDALSPALQSKIMQRWYSVEIKQAQDYTLLLVLVSVLVVIIAFLVYRDQVARRFAGQLERVNARLSDRNKRLEQICQCDYLTGVMNRVSMDTELSRALHRAVQQCHPVSLILMDLDRFHEINRKHGHQVGDTVLVEVSRVLEQTLPDWVRVGRWSGDRFLLICPRTAPEEARVLARKISLKLPVQRYSEAVHISVSLVIRTCDGSERPALVMGGLEQLLIEAKKAGDQQLRVWRSDQASGDSADPAA